jgi:hypothetical protein
LAVLRAAARQAGIDPQRLVVGSRRNSVNPNTGQAEFYYNGPDIEAEARRRNQPAEQQLADLYINLFPESVGGAGHVGIGVNTDKTQGFYPAQSGFVPKVQQGLDQSIPGAVKSDDVNQPHETMRIPTTREQDAAAQSYIDARGQNPGDYNLYRQNCGDFVRDTMRASGIAPPSDQTPLKLDDYLDTIPTLFFKGLRR